MSAPSIKSQPIYHGLDWDSAGIVHLLAAECEDETVALHLLKTLPAAPTRVLHLATPQADRSAWQRLGEAGANVSAQSNANALFAALRLALEHSQMGLRLYLLGSEDFIWTASRIADELGMSSEEIRRHRSGTLARPVYCVHCKAVTHSVRTNIAPCSGCGRMLFVRDHFSRRLGAYMGFQIDAEAPGEIPAIEEVYP